MPPVLGREHHEAPVVGVGGLGQRRSRRHVTRSWKFRRIDFRTFVHAPTRMFAAGEEHGLRPAYSHHPLVWQVSGFER